MELKNKHFIMLLDSVGQESGRGTVGVAFLCSTVSGTSVEMI